MLIFNIYRLFDTVIHITWKGLHMKYKLLSLLIGITSLCVLRIPLYATQINSLSLEQKIGQLITVATVANIPKNSAFIHAAPYHLDPEYAKKMISQYNVGGILFMGSATPQEIALLGNELQLHSNIPLFLCLDAEWGLSMRLNDGVITFPKAMTLGALDKKDDSLIYELGLEIGRQCKAIGICWNFAPVADVNNNPKNPIINTRSFGENPEKVSRKAALFMNGLQDAGVIACAKHFPGHGDTAFDTHKGRALIPHNRARLNAVELVPFKHLIDNNVSSIMTAHLDVPALSDNEAIPATLSPAILIDLLRTKLGFKGLIVSDGLGMKALTDDFEPGELELAALKAGNDILLAPVDVPQAIKRIKIAVETGEISEQLITEKVERILSQKEKLAIEKKISFNASDLLSDSAKELKRKLYRAAATIARNSKKLIPLAQRPIKIVSFGKNYEPFIKTLQKHRALEHIAYDLSSSPADLSKAPIHHEDCIIASIHLEGRSGMIEIDSKNTDTPSTAYLDFIQEHRDHIIVTLFGNPYNLAHLNNISTILVGYENEPEAQEAIAEGILGLHEMTGSLPVTP